MRSDRGGKGDPEAGSEVEPSFDNYGRKSRQKFASTFLLHCRQIFFVCVGILGGKVFIASFSGKIIKTWFHCPQKKPRRLIQGLNN